MSESRSTPPLLPLLTTTIVPDVDGILRLVFADVDCLLKFTTGLPLITFCPLLRNFGESVHIKKFTFNKK